MKTYPPIDLHAITEISALRLQQWKRLSKLAVKRLRMQDLFEGMHPVFLNEATQGMYELEQEIRHLKSCVNDRT